MLERNYRCRCGDARAVRSLTQVVRKFPPGLDQAAMDQYYAAASQPKERRQYSSGHDLNDPAITRGRAHWLAEKLHTPSIIQAFNDEVRNAER